MKKSYGALVVGGGIGGIRTALDLAETGQKVALIEKRPTIGGILLQLDHQFPSDHCGMCKMLPLTERDSSSQFCMRKGLFHKNIDIYLSTELESLEGEPGHFQVMLKKRSSFVDPMRCIGCGECSKVCPVQVPQEFNAGLTSRSAVYLPVPHAIPNHYVVDLDNCQRCWQCYEACPTQAIDFQFDEREDFHILYVGKEQQQFEEAKTWLEEVHFTLHMGMDSDQALDILNREAKIQCVLFDETFSETHRERVVQRAREILPDMSIVLLQGEKRDCDYESLKKQGIQEFFSKPLSRTEFVPWIDKLFMRVSSDEVLEIDVAAVVLAGGFDCYNPSDNPEFWGYQEHPGVVTAVEFERMCSGTGPTNKRLIRPADGKPIKTIAWLQCVGSRDERKNAGFCSSICCMFSIKEALLAKRLGGEEIETSIFYMDMRTFGKNFQRYKDEAEQEMGVQFVNSRIHSIIAAKNEDSVILEYLDDKDVLQEKPFDLVVLATGARPPQETGRLAEVLGVERNAWGFIETRPFAPATTTQHGIYVSGAFAQPRDIAESVITAGAAGLEASRLINIYSPIKEQQPDPEPEYRDVSKEAPKELVALCTSCPIFEQKVDVQSLKDEVESQTHISNLITINRACSKEGWEEIEQEVINNQPNRILIGACMPYAYIPKLRELGEKIKLSPSMMDVVDIYSSTLRFGREEEKKFLERDLYSTLNMASAKLMGSDPSPLPKPIQVTKEALVVGGGLAGITAALGIADHGYGVCLVEEKEALGGIAMNIKTTLEGKDPKKFMEDLIEQVNKHPLIRVFTNARVALSVGRAGKYMSLISSDEGGFPLEHGVTVLATGGQEAKNYEFGYRVNKSVVTQLELDNLLDSGELDTGALKGVAMIQCVGSREEPRNYCSRICCASALKNILTLKRRNPKLPIYVFYRDIMTYGFSETYYTEARKAGAIFIQYMPEQKPEVSFDNNGVTVSGFDSIMQQEITLHVDLLALSNGIVPNDVSDLQEVFGIQVDQDGFYQEAESKWRPVDNIKQGIFLCGIGLAPGNMRETIASAKAAAQRSLRVLSENRLVSSNVVAEVRHSLCTHCGKCIEVCPYEARSLDIEHDRIEVDELLCQGCGSCAAVCPNSASLLRGFYDGQIMSVIDAALKDYV